VSVFGEHPSSNKDSTSSNYKLGILGGIGPEATGILYKRLIQTLQNRSNIQDNTDFPQIFINSIPAPELVQGQIPEEHLQHYIDGLKELDTLNPNSIAMACNTIHLYHNTLQKKIDTPILNLRKEVKKHLEEKDIQKILVIGTPATVKKNLYNFKNLETLKPNKEELKILSSSISNYNKGKNKQKQIQRVKEITEKYLDRGAEATVLACTELSLMLKDKQEKTIDTMDTMINTILKELE